MSAMTEIQHILILDYIIAGVFWGIFATYTQHLLYKKNYFICWALNTVGWPIAMGIKVYNLVRTK